MKKAGIIGIVFCCIMANVFPVFGQDVAVEPFLFQGAVAQKFDIVVIGEGYAESEQSIFNEQLAQLFKELKNKQPFGQFFSAFNIWRINQVSKQSGISSGLLNCALINGKKGKQVLQCKATNKVLELAANAPDYDLILVLCNTSEGMTSQQGQVMCLAANSGSVNLNFIRSISSYMGGLGDESYTLGQGLWEEEDPGYINVSTKKRVRQLKWKHFLSKSAPYPTPNDYRIHPDSAGFYEGAMGVDTGLFRPSNSCIMGNPENAKYLCVVCKKQLQSKISSYCSECDVSEGYSGCFPMGRFLPMEHVSWMTGTRMRWPLPMCTTCPEDQFLERIDVSFKGLGGTDIDFVVIGPMGQKMHAGTPSPEGDLTANFVAIRHQEYWLELIFPELMEPVNLYMEISRHR